MSGFRGYKIVSDSLVLVFMTPAKVKLNKPLHIGATILEHSKRVMYDKFYQFIIPSFDNVELSNTDTDSFLFSCDIPSGETITSLLKKHQDHFDFSNLSENGKLGKDLFSMKNKNQLNR
jgi:hypothetical protein